MRPEALPSAAPPPHDLGPAEIEGPTALDYTYGVLRRRRGISLAVLIAAALTAIVSFILPVWYAATVSFLPAPEETGSTSLSAIVQNFMNPGRGLPENVQAGDLAVELMKSRRVRHDVVEEFGLVERYKARDLDEAMTILTGRTEFYVGQVGIVTVTVEDRDRDVAAAMANRMVELLDRFNALNRMTGGRSTRQFIEGQLDNVRVDLRAAEDSLQHYMERTKQVPLSVDPEGAAAAGREILTRKMQLEIGLEVGREYLSEESETIREMKTELSKIDEQLEEMPGLNIDFARLVRELKVQEGLHTFLRTQFEESKIREQEDTPSLTVIDAAEPPVVRSRPRRKLMVLAAAVVTGMIGLMAALVSTYVELLPPSSRRRRRFSDIERELKSFFKPGSRSTA